MSETPGKTIVRKEGDISIVGFTDRNILDEANIQRIGDEIAVIVEIAPIPKVIVDFTNVEHLSSAALGMLIEISNQVRQKDGHLRLTCIPANILEIFKITKLDKIFVIEKDIASAANSIR